MRGMVRQGEGLYYEDTQWLGGLWQGRARSGAVGPGMVWHCEVGCGDARLGEVT